VNEELNKLIEELKNHFAVLGRGHEVFSRIELRLISEYFLNKIESIKNVPD
jgi:AAA+ ATPase superfamily predicted ATPase